jgi:2-polyprenyl-3-methyl-5-hydroxy-6-metoxy-1,4-benzoquinol methylase
MFSLIDSFFFLIFAAFSLLYWLPVVLLFLIPFVISKKIKSRLTKLSYNIEKVSEKKLTDFKAFQSVITAEKNLEQKSKSLYNHLTNKTYKKTIWWQRMEIIEAVPFGSKVLDIGCGNGYLAELIAKNKKAQVICVDVDDFNQTNIPTILFDGVNLPFADRRFDVVILSFVLHHSEFQQELLSEAARVCRGKIIIYEDETMVGAEAIMGTAHQKIWNFFNSQEGKVTYHSPAQWREIFAQNNLEILEEKREFSLGSFFIPLKRAVFILKNKN